jgi:hypothetical protein
MRRVSGTGQGAAAYGRGVAYAAENPKVSGPGESEYMREFSNHPSIDNAQKIGFVPLRNMYSYASGVIYDSEARKIFIDSGLANLSYVAREHLLDRIRSYRWSSDRLNKDFKTYAKEKDIQDLSTITGTGRNRMVSIINELHPFLDRYFNKSPDPIGPFSYKVHVYLRPETILDWDALIKDHHPEAERKILQTIMNSRVLNTESNSESGDVGKYVNHIDQMINHYGSKDYYRSSTGRKIYNVLVNRYNSDYDASEALFNYGIHGIRYLDQGSRNPKPDIFLDGKKVYDGGNNEIDQSFRDGIVRGKTNTKDFRAITIFSSLFDVPFHLRSIDDLLKHFHDEIRHGRSYSAAEYLDWLDKNGHRIQIVPRKPTYNYVVFHPDFIKAVEQYNIRGEKIRDIPSGVHLREVDRDPFKGEGR